jgi:hypothetical protein
LNIHSPRAAPRKEQYKKEEKRRWRAHGIPTQHQHQRQHHPFNLAQDASIQDEQQTKSRGGWPWTINVSRAHCPSCSESSSLIIIFIIIHQGTRI